MWHASMAAVALTFTGDDGAMQQSIDETLHHFDLNTRKFMHEAYGNRGWMSEVRKKSLTLLVDFNFLLRLQFCGTPLVIERSF